MLDVGGVTRVPAAVAVHGRAFSRKDSPMATDAPPRYRLFHDEIEEHHNVFVQRLAELTACSRMPDRGGYDAAALNALMAWARQGVKDAALALQRMSDGTYGLCEGCGCHIPVGYLRGNPEARYCVPCGNAGPPFPADERRPA
jgi:DnaK suppressor protein